MSKTLKVAWREFKATAMTKTFILAAVFVPALIIGLGLLGPLLFNPKPPPLVGSVAIVDSAGTIAQAAQIEFEPQRIKIRINRRMQEEIESAKPSLGRAMNPQQATEMAQRLAMFDIRLDLQTNHTLDDVQQLKQQISTGDLVALIVADSQGASNGAPESAIKLYIPSNLNFKHADMLEDLTRAAMVRAKVADAGLDVDEVRTLTRSSDPATIRIARDGTEQADSGGAKVIKLMVPMAFMMLIWVGAFVSANYLLTTTIEEKSNKVMEVLLSAVSPLQLMTGKIIGQALVGLVMVSMYLGLGVAALAGAAAADLIEWSNLLYFAIYYVMAYFMIASIMAAIGSAVNELREAQTLMTPAMLLLMVPLMLWLPISDSPNGALATVTSFIPPLIPFVMILRITGSEAIPFWQIPATIVIGYAAMLAMMWLCAKIFRVGVLMYGKPPTPMELLRWVRYR